MVIILPQGESTEFGLQADSGIIFKN